MVLHVIDASARDDEQDRQRDAVDDVLHEIGAGELPIELVLNKIDRSTRSAAAGSRTASPARRRSRRSPARGSTSCAPSSRAASTTAGSACGCSCPYEDGGRLSELYALGTPIEEREDTADGVLVIARLPRRDLPRFAPFLIAESDRGDEPGDAPDRAARSGGCAPTRSCPSARTRATPASTSSSCERVELAPGERALVPTGLAVAIPEGYAGFVQPRSGLALRSTASRSSTRRA